MMRRLVLLALAGCAETYAPDVDARFGSADAPPGSADGPAPADAAGPQADAPSFAVPDSPPPDAFVPPVDAQCGYLWPGQALREHERMNSCNGDYFLLMQGDGNLVLYQEAGASDTPLWASGTNGTAADRAVMQGDGNLVVYLPCSSPCTGDDAVFASGTQDNPGAHLEVRNNGRLIIYSDGGVPLWQEP